MTALHKWRLTRRFDLDVGGGTSKAQLRRVSPIGIIKESLIKANKCRQGVG